MAAPRRGDASPLIGGHSGRRSALSLNEYVEGGTPAYLLRLGSRDWLLFGSMNDIEREIDGLRPDVVFVASARPRLEITDDTARPEIVVATHSDDQGLPFGAPQDKAVTHQKAFVDEVKAVAPSARVVVRLYFQTVVLQPHGTSVLDGPD